MPLLRSALSLAVTLALAVTTFGCKDDSASNTTTGGGGGGNKVLNVGTEATFPPFESRDAQDNFVGIDIDLVKAIGQKIGREVRIKDTKFDTLITGLQQGEIDMIASGFSINEERKQVVAFSDPYLDAPIALAVRADEQAIKSSADLTGKVAAAQSGSTGAAAAETLKSQGKLRDIRYFDNVPVMMQELVSRGVDVVISDRPTSEAYIATAGSGRIKLLDEALQTESYGFAFRKDDELLRQQVNTALAELKASGELQRIVEKHYKSLTAAAPAAPTTAPVK